MKRKLHPRRRHSVRRHIPAASRHESRLEGFLWDFRGQDRHENIYAAFARALPGRSGRPNRAQIDAAGYLRADLARHEDWEAAHAWLKERCTTRYGREYYWSGNRFTFARDADHAAFVRKFPCAGHEHLHLEKENPHAS